MVITVTPSLPVTTSKPRWWPSIIDQSSVSNCRSPAPEPRLALLHECPRRLSMVFGESGMDVVGRLKVQALTEIATHCSIEVLFHVAIGRARAGCQAPCAL